MKRLHILLLSLAAVAAIGLGAWLSADTYKLVGGPSVDWQINKTTGALLVDAGGSSSGNLDPNMRDALDRIISAMSTGLPQGYGRLAAGDANANGTVVFTTTAAATHLTVTVAPGHPSGLRIGAAGTLIWLPANLQADWNISIPASTPIYIESPIGTGGDANYNSGEVVVIVW